MPNKTKPAPASTAIDVKSSMSEINKKQEQHLARIAELAKTDRLIQLGQLYYERELDEAEKEDTNRIVKQLEGSQKTLEKIDNSLSDKGALPKKVEKLGESLKKVVSGISPEAAKKVSEYGAGQKYYKTVGDRIGGMKEGVKNFFTMRGFLDKTGIVSKGGGGMLDTALERREAKQQYINDRMKMEVGAGRMVDTKENRKAFGAQFARQQKTIGSMQKNEAEISRLQAAGYSEKDIENAGLMGTRASLSKQLVKDDPRARRIAKEQAAQESDAPLIVKKKKSSGASESTADKKSEGLGAADMTESEMENAKRQDQQIELLTKIEKNTGVEGKHPSNHDPVKPEASGGGFLSGGLGKALGKMKDFGMGLVLVAGALFIAAKAFKSFAEVAWEDVGKGMAALGGLVLAAFGLSKVQGDMIKGAIGLGALALATWGISAAFKTFSDLDWETIGKGFVAIAGLGALGVLLGTFAGPAFLGAAALGALGAAVWVVGQGFDAMGESFNKFVDGIERLAGVGFQGLAGVAGGLMLLGPALAVFAAGQALAGMGNLVSGFLSAVSGQKSPVDQLIEIGKSGDGITKAAQGLGQISEAMKGLAGIDKKSMEAINEFPWVRATAFVAAGGAMQAAGAKVYNAKGAGSDSGSKVAAASSDAAMAKTPDQKSSNVVVAPTTTNVTNAGSTVVAKPMIRHNDPTINRYISNRYAVA